MIRTRLSALIMKDLLGPSTKLVTVNNEQLEQQ
jgi:hypothetical protein